MLTIMTILSGLVSSDLPGKLLARRRDIMIESAAYDLIKQEGIKEGLASGIQQGLEQGLRQGLRQAIADNLEARFGMAPESIVRAIDGIDDIPTLKRLPRVSS